MFTLATGGNPTNTLFVVTSGATEVNTFTPNTPNTDTEFYLVGITGRQYTLYHYPTTFNDIGLNVLGTSGRIYRAMAMLLLDRFDPDQFFSNMGPVRVDRAGVEHISMRGNRSVQRRADASVKREIQFTTSFTSQAEWDIFKFIHENHANFAFVRNPLIHFDEVFPAAFKGDIQYPYAGWDWDAGYSFEFNIAEQ